MRTVTTFILLLVLTSSTFAAELSNNRVHPKNNTHTGMNPGTPDGREGGEDMDTAFTITALPFNDIGNTSDNIDDFDVECNYTGSTSPDVFYSYTPNSGYAEMVSVDLCGSGYDTKTYILDADYNVIACNDDYYDEGDDCGDWVSYIEYVPLYGGVEYFIVVDGYGGDSGDYTLNVNYYIPYEPCDLTCEGIPEGEPALGPDYEDVFNSGCSNAAPGNSFQDLAGNSIGELVFCGTSGWYEYTGSTVRDTDWFTAIIGESGTLEWTLDAEEETYGFLLGPQDCSEVGPIETMSAGPCSPATMTIQGSPGEIVWLWVGPTEFEAPEGFGGFEYNYIGTFTGLNSGTVSTDQVSFDAIKSLYR